MKERVPSTKPDTSNNIGAQNLKPSKRLLKLMERIATREEPYAPMTMNKVWHRGIKQGLIATSSYPEEAVWLTTKGQVVLGLNGKKERSNS